MLPWQQCCSTLPHSPNATASAAAAVVMVLTSIDRPAAKKAERSAVPAPVQQTRSRTPLMLVVKVLPSPLHLLLCWLLLHSPAQPVLQLLRPASLASVRRQLAGSHWMSRFTAACRCLQRSSYLQITGPASANCCSRLQAEPSGSMWCTYYGLN